MISILSHKSTYDLNNHEVEKNILIQLSSTCDSLSEKVQ